MNLNKAWNLCPAKGLSMCNTLVSSVIIIGNTINIMTIKHLMVFDLYILYGEIAPL